MLSPKQAEDELSDTLNQGEDKSPFSTATAKKGTINGEPAWVWNRGGEPEVPGLTEEFDRMWDKHAGIDKSQIPTDPADPDYDEYAYEMMALNAGETVYDNASSWVLVFKSDIQPAANIAESEGSPVSEIIYFETKAFDMGNGYWAVAGMSGL